MNAAENRRHLDRLRRGDDAYVAELAAQNAVKMGREADFNRELSEVRRQEDQRRQRAEDKRVKRAAEREGEPVESTGDQFIREYAEAGGMGTSDGLGA